MMEGVNLNAGADLIGQIFSFNGQFPFSTELGVMALGGHRPASLASQPLAAALWTP